MEEIINGIIKLYDDFHNKKQEIHEQIKIGFGTEQYKEKLFNYVEKVIDDL